MGFVKKEQNDLISNSAEWVYSIVCWITSTQLVAISVQLAEINRCSATRNFKLLTGKQRHHCEHGVTSL